MIGVATTFPGGMGCKQTEVLQTIYLTIKLFTRPVIQFNLRLRYMYMYLLLKFRTARTKLCFENKLKTLGSILKCFLVTHGAPKGPVSYL